MEREVQKFINQVRSYLKDYGFSLSLEPVDFILTNNIPVSGYFSENESTIKIATNKPLIQWLAILVHEYGHFLQFIEQAPEYRQIKNGNENYLDLFDLWLNHKIELSDSKKQEVFSSIFNLERDCELRALSLITEYNLPLNTEEYTQKANSYLQTYNQVYNNRIWPENNQMAYNQPQVYLLMPKNELLKELQYVVS